MSAGAPTWLVELLGEHQLGGFGMCSCAWLADDRFRIPSDAIKSQHRAHVAEVIWGEFTNQVAAGLREQPPPSICFHEDTCTEDHCPCDALGADA